MRRINNDSDSINHKAIGSNTIKTNIEEADLQLNTIKSKAQTLIPHRQRRGLVNFFDTSQKWLFTSINDNDWLEIEEHLNVIELNNHKAIKNFIKQINSTHFNETFSKLKSIIEKDCNTITSKLNNGIHRQLY